MTFSSIPRRHTDCVKYDALEKTFGRADLIPLWVADMDWPTPPFVIDALRERLDHPVLGYPVTPADYWPTVQRWILDHHGWPTREEWFTFIPGIVKGIGMAVNALLRPGDKVIVQPPVYHPFYLVPERNGHEVVWNPLIPIEEDGRLAGYRMDFDNLAEVADDSCRMLILANPHNPVGIVWDADTLRRLAAFCHERGIIVIADEIHCDMALFGHRHTPFASVSPEAAEISVTFSAPSKTFNMAGIVSSWAVVPNEELRSRFFSWLEASELNAPTFFATVATKAALTKGESWRREMIEYIEANVRFVEEFCREHLPAIRPVRPQASFLVWLDCRGLGLSPEALQDFFVNRVGLALNDGAIFGPGGAGFLRLNVGTDRETLQKAFKKLLDNLEKK